MSAHDISESHELDEIVDAFESAIAAGHSCAPQDFLPQRSNPEFERIVVELVRVDLERNWRNGVPKSAEDYVLDFPDVFADRHLRSLIAYEEFRVRCQLGEKLQPEEFAQRLAVDVADWSYCAEPPASQSNAALSFRRWLRAAKDDAGRDDMAQRLTTAFPEFDIVEELGRGTFACVFLARQRDLANRNVVIKITGDTTNEPERLACLQHSGIVPVYSVHRSSEWQAMCMPFLGRLTLADAVGHLRGRTLPSSGLQLAESLRDSLPNGPVTGTISELSAPMAEGFGHSDYSDCYPRSVCWVISKLADALEHAHRRGLLHRDVKPANILIADDGQPMLLDFNLSSEVRSPSVGHSTVGGTLPYLAPEHLRSLTCDQEVLATADVYSLGAVMYALLTGRLPFPARDGTDDASLEQMRLDRLQPIASVRSLNPQVSVAVSGIVEKCLQPEIEDRYQSAAQLSEDLNCELNWHSLRHAANESKIELFRKWKKRHPRVLSRTSLAILFGLTLLATGVSWKIANDRLFAAEALQLLHEFDDSVRDVRTLLTTPDANGPGVEEGMANANQAMEGFQTVKGQTWVWKPTFQTLTPAHQAEVRRNVFEMCYLMAATKANQARRADAAAAPGLLEEALQFNQRATEAVSAEGYQKEASFQKATFMEMSGEQSAADALRESASTRFLQGETDTLLTGLRHLSNDEFSPAAAVLEQSVMDRPHDYSGWSLLGKAFLGDRKLDQAEGCFTTCIALNPKCWTAWQDRGILRLSERKFRDAKSDFDQLILLRPEIAEAYLNRSLVRHELGDFPGALADATASIELNGPTRAWFVRARFRHSISDATGAAEDYQQGLAARPNDDLSWVARGTARLPNDPQGALADYEQALNNNPRCVSALQNLSHVLSEQLGRKEEAIDVLNQLIALAPDDADAIAGRGVLLARMKQLDAAEQDAKRLLSLQPTPLQVYQAACIYALLVDERPEFEALAVQLVADALRQQPGLISIAKMDTDIDNIRKSLTFQTSLDALEKLSTVK